MRIAAIKLSWFRGAATEALLSPNGGSMFVYGENGAGKSSIVDGLEVCVHNGKIDHLGHEYSGKHQERGLINTHRPRDKSTTVSVVLEGERFVTAA